MVGRREVENTSGKGAAGVLAAVSTKGGYLCLPQEKQDDLIAILAGVRGQDESRSLLLGILNIMLNDLNGHKTRFWSEIFLWPEDDQNKMFGNVPDGFVNVADDVRPSTVAEWAYMAEVFASRASGPGGRMDVRLRGVLKKMACRGLELAVFEQVASGAQEIAFDAGLLAEGLKHCEEEYANLDTELLFKRIAGGNCEIVRKVAEHVLEVCDPLPQTGDEYGNVRPAVASAWTSVTQALCREVKHRTGHDFQGLFFFTSHAVKRWAEGKAYSGVDFADEVWHWMGVHSKPSSMREAFAAGLYDSGWRKKEMGEYHVFAENFYDRMVGRIRGEAAAVGEGEIAENIITILSPKISRIGNEWWHYNERMLLGTVLASACGMGDKCITTGFFRAFEEMAAELSSVMDKEAVRKVADLANFTMTVIKAFEKLWFETEELHQAESLILLQAANPGVLEISPEMDAVFH